MRKVHHLYESDVFESGGKRSCKMVRGSTRSSLYCVVRSTCLVFVFLLSVPALVNTQSLCKYYPRNDKAADKF